MALIFEALEPTFALSGSSPQYRVRFFEESTGDLTDPDNVDALEVMDSGGNLLRTFIPPDIVQESTGVYRVDDDVVDDPQVFFLRWTYTEGGDQRTVSVAYEVVDNQSGQAKNALKEYVLSRLGKGVMVVEIPAGTLDFCIDQAMTWYAMHVGQTKRVRLNMVSGQQRYDVAEDCYYVVDVALPGNMTRVSEALGVFGVYGFSQLGMGDIPVEDIFGGSGTQGFYGGLVQSLQYAEMGRRVLSNAPSWEWLQMSKKLVLFPPPANISSEMVVDYVSTEIDLASMNPQEKYFIREYVTAEAKEALGRIRGKYSGYPSAEGERMLDADTLLAEASESKRTLNEKIGFYAPSGWIITG